MADKIEQADILAGLLGQISWTGVFAGVGTTNYVIIPGGKHPKMKLDCKDAYRSKVICLAFDTADPVIAVSHPDLREAAASGGGLGAAGDFEGFTASTTKGQDTFEADEDVLVGIKSAGNAATDVLVTLQFEPVE